MLLISVLVGVVIIGAVFLVVIGLRNTGRTDALEARLEAFNPLVPADADASGIPVAILRYVLRNHGDAPVTATVCGSLRNFIGLDGQGAPSGRFDFILYIRQIFVDVFFGGGVDVSPVHADASSGSIYVLSIDCLRHTEKGNGGLQFLS